MLWTMIYLLNLLKSKKGSKAAINPLTLITALLQHHFLLDFYFLPIPRQYKATASV